MFTSTIKNSAITLPPDKKPNWQNILFLSATHLIAIIGIPIYILTVGVTLGELILAFAFYIATGLAITVGYHRMMSHRAFTGSGLVHFLTLFFGAASFEMSALDWCSLHRDHHSFTDTDKDPYNIKKGFFYAHMGWLLFWKFNVNHTNVKDLQKSAMAKHQHIYYLYWAIGAGIILPLLIGLLTGHFLGALLLAVCGRITLTYQGTFCINSVCHVFGKFTYDARSSARDHWITALVTFGEGYHNFHHRFPSDYRNGFKWYHFDPSKWMIATLKFFNQASNLMMSSPFTILTAKITAETRRAELTLNRLDTWKGKAAVLQKVKSQYESLLKSLYEWEIRFKEYRNMRVTHKPQELIRAALLKVRENKRQFRRAYGEWQSVVSRAVHLQKAAPLLT